LAAALTKVYPFSTLFFSQTVRVALRLDLKRAMNKNPAVSKLLSAIALGAIAALSLPANATPP